MQDLATTLPMRVKDGPVTDRPRERLLRHGAANLRVAELLAILIRSGRSGESAMQAGERIAAAFAHRLDELSAAGQGELKMVSKAIGPSAYCQIMAGIELGRRVAAANADTAPKRLLSTEEAKRFCQKKFHRLAVDHKHEEFHIVTLGTKNQVIATHQISVGTLDASLVHPREVFRPAIKDAAASVILVHNHPSGDPTPSQEDISVTKRLEDAGKTLGIDVLDHIIVAGDRSLSLAQHR